MSYSKHTWEHGEVIDAAKLNNIETGIEEAKAAGLPVVTAADNGKIVKVVNGSWAAVAEEEYNGTVSVE